MAPSPIYSRDNTLFMLTFGGEHSLWRSPDGGNTWARIFASTLANVDSIKLVGLPPQYGDNSQTVFIAGESQGKPAVWKSTDNGQSFRRRFTQNPTTGAAFPIDSWAIVDSNTLFIGSYDGSNALVYETTNSGLLYSGGAPAGNQFLKSIALSPGYEQDKTILTGNTNGGVYWSDDNGISFEPLPADATTPPLPGSIAVAFDPEFNRNRTVYAASDTADKGVYRFIIGTSNDWESTDNTMPSGAKLNQLTVGSEGTLYAANSQADGGMERCLNPAYSLGPTFETVTRGLSAAATLSGVWQSDHRLWSVDTTNIRLMTFNDTLTSPVTTTSPDNKASSIGSIADHTIRNVSLDWETLEGATSYRWQLDYDTDFSSIPSGFEDNSQASSAHLPNLEPATTYYWRVRASAPVLSPWSDKWSFTTIMDTEAIAITLENPQAGASDMPIRPVFQWTAVAGADAYELLVATDNNFTNPSIIKQDDYALSATAWKCDLSLDYDTTYYWKVRAISTSTRSSWSTVGAFTTESPPPPVSPLPPATQAPSPPAKPAEPTPENALTDRIITLSPMQITAPAPTPTAPLSPIIIQSPSIPNWGIYLIGALLLTIVMTLFIILTLVIRIMRS